MHPKTYVCGRSPSRIVLDGDLTKSQWHAAHWTDDFQDIEGHIRPKPRHRTRAKMLWDEDYFYIGAELEEPHIWATLGLRDSIIFQDNDFEVFIDPDADSHNYVEFELNAFNTVWDLLLAKPYKDGGRPLNGWRFKGIQSAVKIDGTINDPSDEDRGWSVEIAIPWSSMSEVCSGACPPRLGDQWRINFSRVEWDVEIVDGKYAKVPGRPEHNWVWSPQGAIDMHRPERWGIVQFSESASDPFKPDLTLQVRDQLHEVYYAERAFRKQHGRWAASALELGMDDCPVAIHETPSLLELVCGSWHLTSDGRIWDAEAAELNLRPG